MISCETRVSARHSELSKMPGRALDYVMREGAIRSTEDSNMREALRVTQVEFFKALKPEERAAVFEFMKRDSERQAGANRGSV